jgi:hypothetical protein
LRHFVRQVNFDWETVRLLVICDYACDAHRTAESAIDSIAQGFPFGIINPFLTELAEAMHNATPPLGVVHSACVTFNL